MSGYDHMVPTCIPQPGALATSEERTTSIESCLSPSDCLSTMNDDSSYMSYEYSDDEDEEYDDGSYRLRSGKSELCDVISAAERQRVSQASSAISYISDGGHRFCNTVEAQRYMQDTIKEVSDLLCIPQEATVVLLRNYKWDGKRLMDDYFGDKQQAILVKCGVLKRSSASGSVNTKDLGFKSVGLCAICFENGLDPDELFSMDCRHEFCKECWRGYILEAVSRGPQCLYTQCPHPKCGEVVTNEEVRKLAPDALAKFEEYQFRSYVETNWIMRWCPGPSCDRVAVGSSAGLIGEGQCKCGTQFCLRCGEMRHVPATCDMMVFWKERCQDENKSVDWIITTTKKCPKCKTRIDKSGGCSHMHCSQCNYHFCWMCMQGWDVHGYDRTCNKFELDQAKTVDKEKDDAERHLHCFDRFQNHSHAQDFAKGELETFEQLQEEREKSDSSFDCHAVKDALSLLIECRRVLKYTYVVTYCLADRPVQRELFEDHQALLERFTERLSEVSERGYSSINRTELVNLTKAVARYAKSIMECETDEGI